MELRCDSCVCPKTRCCVGVSGAALRQLRESQNTMLCESEWSCVATAEGVPKHGVVAGECSHVATAAGVPKHGGVGGRVEMTCDS